MAKKTKKTENLKLGDKIWKMVDNKACELTISKINKSDTLVLKQNEEKDDHAVVILDIYASVNSNLDHNHKVITGNYFATKQQLINSL